jgi:hypothetical protein
MPKLYEEEPSAILYKQLHPRIASFYKTFGDEAWTQHILNLDAPLLAAIEEFSAREVGSQVSDDAVWYPKPEYYVMYKLHCFG